MYLSSLICVVFVGLRIRIDPTQSIRNPFLLQRVSSPNFAHTYSIFDNNFCAISKPFIYLLWTWPYICLIVYVYELIKQKSMKQSSCLCKQPPVFLCGRRQTCVGFLIIVKLNQYTITKKSCNYSNIGEVGRDINIISRAMWLTPTCYKNYILKSMFLFYFCY